MKSAIAKILLFTSFAASPAVWAAGDHARLECMTGGYVLPLASIEDSELTVWQDENGRRVVSYAVDRAMAWPMTSPTVFEFTGHKVIRGVMVVIVVRFDLRERTYSITRADWDEQSQLVTCDELSFKTKF